MDRNGGGGSDPADVQGQAKDAAFRPRFMEVPTFLRLPLAETAAGLDIALSGIPFDLGVTNRPGTRHGPRQVRDLSSLQRTRHPTMDLGANRLQTFFLITLPNIRTAVVGSALLVFTLSFDELPVTFFLTGAQNTLPMHIWSMLRIGITPEINAIASLTVGVSIVLILIGLRLLARNRET